MPSEKYTLARSGHRSLLKEKLLTEEHPDFFKQFFEDVLASKWPQRPNLKSLMAFSWQKTPSNVSLFGMVTYAFLASFELSKKIKKRTYSS